MKMGSSPRSAPTGQAAIIARYQGHVSVSSIVVPLGAAIPNYTFAPNNYIDKLARKKWQELGIVPSDLCGDEVFVRRVYLDIGGTLPTPKQVNDFVADKRSDKRAKLVDALLDSPEYATTSPTSGPTCCG